MQMMEATDIIHKIRKYQKICVTFIFQRLSGGTTVSSYFVYMIQSLQGVGSSTGASLCQVQAFFNININKIFLLLVSLRWGVAKIS